MNSCDDNIHTKIKSTPCLHAAGSIMPRDAYWFQREGFNILFYAHHHINEAYHLHMLESKKAAHLNTKSSLRKPLSRHRTKEIKRSTQVITYLWRWAAHGNLNPLVQQTKTWLGTYREKGSQRATDIQYNLTRRADNATDKVSVLLNVVWPKVSDGRGSIGKN